MKRWGKAERAIYVQLNERLKVLKDSRQKTLMSLCALDGAIGEVDHALSAFGANGFQFVEEVLLEPVVEAT